MYIPPAVIIFTQSINSMKEIFIECPLDDEHFATFVDTATVMSTYTSMGDGQGPLFTARSVWCRRSLCILIHLMSSPRCLSAEEHGKQTQTLSIFFCSTSSQWKRGLDSWMCSVGSERWGRREDHASPPWQLWEGSQVSLLSITGEEATLRFPLLVGSFTSTRGTCVCSRGGSLTLPSRPWGSVRSLLWTSAAPAVVSRALGFTIVSQEVTLLMGQAGETFLPSLEPGRMFLLRNLQEQMCYIMFCLKYPEWIPFLAQDFDL